MLERASSLSMGNDMLPMRLSTQNSMELELKPVVAHISKHKKANGVLIIIVSLVFIAFFMLTFSTKNSPSSHGIQTKNDKRPVDLRYLVRSATLRAQQRKKLVPTLKSQPELFVDHGAEFLLSYLKEPGLRSRSPSTGDDPFDSDHLDPYLFVSMVPPLHSLVLNKFTSIEDHAILITTRFSMQNTLLTYDDLETWFWCVLNMQAVGFYNSDPAAGSSQRHKHMQLVPLDSIRKMYPTSVASSQTALPVEKLIFPRIQSGEWKVYNPIAAEDAVQTLPEFSFPHGLLVLMDDSEWLTSTGARFSFNEYLFTAYSHLLAAVLDTSVEGAEKLPSYNLILAQRYMLIVPRRREDFADIVSVNGLGFIGLLMAKNESAFNRMKSVGPLSVLQGVAGG